MMIKHIFQKEPVLSIATCLAKKALKSYCTSTPMIPEFLLMILHTSVFRTLAILFSLMTVMAGLRGQGVFDRLGHALLSHTRTTLQLTVVLVGLCFFSSMLITNDVALLTFVPFAVVVLGMAHQEKALIWVVVMQTAAANLGSMAASGGTRQQLTTAATNAMHRVISRFIKSFMCATAYIFFPFSTA